MRSGVTTPRLRTTTLGQSPRSSQSLWSWMEVELGRKHVNRPMAFLKVSNGKGSVLLSEF